MADIVDELGEALAPSNAAYALFRLGCLYSFMSTQRKQGVPLSPAPQALLCEPACAPPCCILRH